MEESKYELVDQLAKKPVDEPDELSPWEREIVDRHAWSDFGTVPLGSIIDIHPMDLDEF